MMERNREAVLKGFRTMKEICEQDRSKVHSVRYRISAWRLRQKWPL